MAKNNSPFDFIQQVRAEGAKVTWPSRKETLITSALVVGMIIISSLFFLLTDTIIRWGLGLLLGIGR